MGHTKLCTTDIESGDHPHITQKPYTLLLRHNQSVWDDLELLVILELFQKVSPLGQVLLSLHQKHSARKTILIALLHRLPCFTQYVGLDSDGRL